MRLPVSLCAPRRVLCSHGGVVQIRRAVLAGRIGESWQQQYASVTLVEVLPYTADHLRVFQCFYDNPEYGPSRGSHRITRIQVRREQPVPIHHGCQCLCALRLLHTHTRVCSQRIQDIRRIKIYEEMRDRMAADIGAEEVNERFLFRDINKFVNIQDELELGNEVRYLSALSCCVCHGANGCVPGCPAQMPMISLEKQQNGGLFSSGWYFAENSRYCLAKYDVEMGNHHERQVLMVRVLCGRIRDFDMETRR